MSTLTPEEVGQLINGFGLPPGPATMFARAIEAELRKRWFAAPYAFEVHYEDEEELVYAGWLDRYASDQVRACPRSPLYAAPKEQPC